MMRTALLSVCAVVGFSATVRLRERAMDPGFVAKPHPLEVARPADLVRATEATCLPGRVGVYVLSGVRRGGNDSRQLIYRNGTRAISIFSTGRRFRALSNHGEWSAVSIGYGRVGRMRVLDSGLVAIAWMHQGRRCTAMAAIAPEQLREFVRDVADRSVFGPSGI